MNALFCLILQAVACQKYHHLHNSSFNLKFLLSWLSYLQQIQTVNMVHYFKGAILTSSSWPLLSRPAFGNLFRFQDSAS